ncbi:MAG: GNAT family N-acetyltransferase [Clostridium sp.]
MLIYEVVNKKSISPLFEGWQETLIWSCLQDCMGKAFTDNLINPESAQILIGDFCFFAGIPKEELVRNKPEYFQGDFIIMVPQNEEWAELIEKEYAEKAVKRERYATKKEKDIFDKDNLNKIVKGLDISYELKIIDKTLYDEICKSNWAYDLCSQFKTYDDYKRYGIGVVVLKDKEIVSGASSYTVYKEGIEIEIDTRTDERRKGLALCCGAKLILECLKRNLYPSWDAQNKGSLALSEKLGYNFDNAYIVYEITGF